MGGDAQQDLALGDRFAHALEVSMLQIAQAAVNDLETVARGARSKIILFDQGHRKAGQGRFARRGGPVNSSADDEQVKFVLADLIEVALHYISS